MKHILLHQVNTLQGCMATYLNKQLFETENVKIILNSKKIIVWLGATSKQQLHHCESTYSVFLYITNVEERTCSL